MAALTDDRATEHQLEGEIRRYPQGTTKIWKGSLVMLNSSGFAVPAADAAGSHGVVGVAVKTTAAPTANGDNDVEVLTGVARLVATAITAAMVGQMMYVVDDQTFDDAIGTNAVKAGALVKRESNTDGWILITGKPPGRGVPTADADATYGQAEADLINAIKDRFNLYAG